jgi:Holliday junction resolvasome RuvABC endonuclease subunit
MIDNAIIIGCDPSSKKLAAVISFIGKEEDADIDIYKLKAKEKALSCAMAFTWARRLGRKCLEQSADVVVFVEAPVFGRGGPGSTIPQAQINGALLAGFSMAGITVMTANNSHWKKEVIGKGNANKVQIKEWVQQYWPAMYLSANNDQDVIDAAAIYIYGSKVVARSRTLMPNKKKIQVHKHPRTALS